MIMVIDPVCQMEINLAKAAAVLDYKGEIYYFCALACKNLFEKEPEKYLIQSAEGHEGHSHMEAQ